MSNDVEETTRGWYKVFGFIIFAFFVFFAFLFSQCRLEFNGLVEVLEDVRCVAFLLLAIVFFLFGMFITLIGLDHAHQVGKKGWMFYVLLIAYIAAAALFII